MKSIPAISSARFAAGLLAGAIIVCVDNVAFEGEASPIVIVALLLAATTTVATLWGGQGWLAVTIAWACVPGAHLFKHLLGLPDTLHPNTYRSIFYLAVFTLFVAIAGATLGLLIRRLARGSGDLESHMPEKRYTVMEAVAKPRLVAGVRARVARGRIGQEFGQYLDQVCAAARSGAVELDGQNIFIYRECIGDLLTVDFCVGATAPFVAVGAVLPFYTPGGLVATTTHLGPYAGLGAANAAIGEWCSANDRRRAGPSWEVYGHWHEDAARLRTDVYYLLLPAKATTEP